MSHQRVKFTANSCPCDWMYFTKMGKIIFFIPHVLLITWLWHLESMQDCDYNENNIWLLRRGRKKLYHVYLVLLGYLILTPKCHAVQKPVATGEIQIARNEAQRIHSHLASSQQLEPTPQPFEWHILRVGPPISRKPPQPMKCRVEMAAPF